MSFSVLMSVYNDEQPEYLRISLQSIISQSLKPGEVVLVKDGPISPELDGVIDTFVTNYPDLIKVIALSYNMGLGDALREGLKCCSYPIVARMDSDDISLPDRFALQMAALTAERSIDVVGGWIEEFLDGPATHVSLRAVPLEPEDIRKYGRFRCPVNHVTVMFRKAAVLAAGSYRKWQYNEDYDLWSRMLLKGYCFRNLPEVLVRVRLSEATFSRRGGLKYFKSEIALQLAFLREGYINVPIFIFNFAVRVLVQLLLPNGLRLLLYRKAFRAQSA